MTIQMFLENFEIAQMTGKKRKTAQKVALNALGITYRETPSGEIKILREHVVTQFGGTINNTEKTEQEHTPDWGCIS